MEEKKSALNTVEQAAKNTQKIIDIMNGDADQDEELARIDAQIAKVKSDIAFLRKLGGTASIAMEDLQELYEKRRALTKSKEGI